MTEPSLDDLERSAAAGDAAASFELYLRYATGRKGATRDTTKAMLYLVRAATAGHATAQRFLAREVYAEEPLESLAWAEKAAAQGDAEAMLHAARMLLSGRDRAPDPDRALALLERASAAGHLESRELLANERSRHAARGRPDAENVARALDEVGLAPHAPRVLAMARPSVRLVATPRSRDEIPLGASRLGGAPDLPEGMAWPSGKTKPLAFVAQVDLGAVGALVPAALPAEGVLAAFVDVESFGQEGRILHFSRSGIVRRAPPEGAKTFRSCALDAFAELTVPPARSALARSLPEDAHEPYRELAARLGDAYLRRPIEDGRVHRFLGHPDAIQGDMTRRLEYALAGADLDAPVPELEERAATWRLILQIDSEPAAGMMWGDLGRLFYWLRDDDLAAGRFERARVQLQS